MTIAIPGLRFFADLHVEVGAALASGPDGPGQRRLVPILGGEAGGDGWRARVLPGGADFQRVVSATATELDARYLLETDAGDRIHVVNRAIRSGSAEAMSRLARGEPVDPGHVYFRCVPRFETAAPALAWINERLFVGSGRRHPASVELRIWLVE